MRRMAEELREVVGWLALFGVPGVFTMVVFLFKTVMKAINNIEILQKAQKAQMRSQLLKQYDDYMAQGYIEPIYLDDWINQYNAYHVLVGPNAVLDARKEDLIHLPNHKPAV
jgi:hypothetical protein